MKCYLAGPMTGYEDFNIPAFRAAKELLEKRGYEILLPHDIDNPIQNATWAQYLAEDIKIIDDRAEGMIFLPGWEKSKGARLEAYTALLLGRPMWQLILDGVDPELEELPHPLVAGVCAAQWVPKEIAQKLGLAA